MEDDKDVAELMELILRDEFRCDVLSTETGKEALRVARTEKIDLTILDYIIPGLNGIEVYNTLKADPATQAIPILCTTAADEKVLVGSGIADCIAKPFELGDFIDRVARLLNSAAP